MATTAPFSPLFDASLGGHLLTQRPIFFLGDWSAVS